MFQEYIGQAKSAEEIADDQQYADTMGTSLEELKERGKTYGLREEETMQWLLDLQHEGTISGKWLGEAREIRIGDVIRFVPPPSLRQYRAYMFGQVTAVNDVKKDFKNPNDDQKAMVSFTVKLILPAERRKK